MEMHQLRYVVAVARTGNFSRAAEACHVSQPSLSQQIQKLEDELGERLFDRLKHGAKLRPAGEAFLRRAVRILDEVEAAKREAADARNLLRGTLTLGVLPTIAPYFLPGPLAQFAEKHPGVELMIQEDTTAQLLKMVLACELDLVLASRPIREVRCEVCDLFSEELLLALPAAHRLAHKRTVALADLEGEHLIVMKEGHCLGDQVLAFCDQGNVQARISFRSAQLETILALVSAGMGLSLIPAMAVDPRRTERIRYRSLEPSRPTRKVVALWLKQRPLSRAASEFLSLLTAGAATGASNGQGHERALEHR